MTTDTWITFRLKDSDLINVFTDNRKRMCFATANTVFFVKPHYCENGYQTVFQAYVDKTEAEAKRLEKALSHLGYSPVLN